MNITQMAIMAVFDMVLVVMAHVVMMAMTHTFMNSCAPYTQSCSNNCKDPHSHEFHHPCDHSWEALLSTLRLLHVLKYHFMVNTSTCNTIRSCECSFLCKLWWWCMYFVGVVLSHLKLNPTAAVKPPSKTVCKFHPKCTNMDCAYLHPMVSGYIIHIVLAK